MPETPTRELHEVGMYLPEELIDDLELTFSEHNLALSRQGHPKLEKNRHFRALALALGLNQIRAIGPEAAVYALLNDDRLADPPDVRSEE